ncbi:mitochondrial import inner membrane translocase subunit Tim54 [Zychaea mexicana]|uniref:mitochondrial import inner membrane translocase subunit Tim54 n=1 Tax=Zychaea mexicana TaxID=64656 RepID=UPI0022FEB43F|nr:mitochondrial import inner membrane translocase subunit Tim54 [Zychaea mexicana]KAI9479518.1 mitochondrial import inner membrane translocase subunit Tim54 [Zychaea mexicana]
MTKLPFGMKAPSKGTVIFCSVLSAISGTVYASSESTKKARQAHCDKVSFLADRPCGVHEMPRKVCVYLMPPPGDSIEKSRVWFREYIKPILVAGAVDYDVKEGKDAGAVESAVCEEIKRMRREEAAAAAATTDPSVPAIDAPLQSEDPHKSNPFAPLMKDVQKKIQEQNHYDGVIAIGRLAWREVLNGVAKGCHADPFEKPKEEQQKEEQKEESTGELDQQQQQQQQFEGESNVPIEEPSKQEEVMMTDLVEENPVQKVDHFSIPANMSPIIYVPHENIIGWTNIPYRLFRWVTDYTRMEDIGQYAVDVILKQTRALQVEDIDVGQQEKKYWIGEEAEEAVNNDTPITLEDNVRSALSTYTKSDSQ